MSFAKISGTGIFIPDKILSNKDLEALVDTSDEWIKARTGISERRILDKDKATSDMCYDACVQALKNSKLINVPLKDMSIPDGIRIGIICREGKISIPDKETIIHENDDVVFISLLKSIRKAEDLFQVSEIY